MTSLADLKTKSLINILVMVLCVFVISIVSAILTQYSANAQNTSVTHSTPGAPADFVQLAVESQMNELAEEAQLESREEELVTYKTDEIGLVNESFVATSASKTAPVSAVATEDVVSEVPAVVSEVPDEEIGVKTAVSAPSNIDPIVDGVVPAIASDQSFNALIEKEIALDVMSADAFMETVINDIYQLTNRERERVGVSALAYDKSLANIAKGHSEDMSVRSYFSHTAPTGCDLNCRVAAAGYVAAAWGENIAWRSSKKLPEAEDLAAYFVTQWMASDGHRRSMLSENFTHTGLGLAMIGNKVYATANFSQLP